MDSESRLRVDGLGPVRIGMSLEGARAVSGLPMVYGEAAACVGYRTDGPPAGVGFTSVEGSQRLDFIDVSEPSVVRPDDRSLDHLALALVLSEGKVAEMWAGLRVAVEADEACA